LVFGIVLNYYLNYSIPIYVPLILLFISLFIKNKTGFFILNFAVFLLGFAIIYEKPIERISKNPVFISCKVISIPKNYFYGKYFKCHIEKSDFKEIKNRDINVFIKNNQLEIFYFSDLAFIGKLNKKGKEIVAYPRKNFIKVDNSKNPFIFVYKLKRYLIENYETETLNKDAFQIGLPLIFGEKGYISPETREIFGKTGLSHLLAISGLHVGILIVSLLFILYFFSYKVKHIVILLILPFYAVFTGLQIPVLRSSVMAGLYFFSKIKYLKINSLNILFFVGFIILLFAPKQIFSIGFQLSFIATLGIILGLDLVNFKTEKLPRILIFLIQMLIVSFVATIFTLPLILKYFGGFSFISIIATPIAILPLYPYLFLSILNLLTFMKLEFLVKLMDFFGILFLKIANFFYSFDIYFQGFDPSILLILLYLTGISLTLIFNFNIYKKVLIVFTFTTLFLFGSKTDHSEFKIYSFKSKNLPVVLIFTPEREGYYIGDSYNYKIKTVLRKENPLRLFLIYTNNKPYKIVESLNLDIEDYFRLRKRLKIKNYIQIEKQKGSFILKIKKQNIILRNQDRTFTLRR
jgi:competence protein ComEC